LPSFPWSAKRYISSRHLLNSHFGPQPAPSRRGADVAGQAPTLTVGEPQSSSAELFSQNAILLAQIVNDEQLMLVHPTGDGD
jgi:hypothetical protein